MNTIMKRKIAPKSKIDAIFRCFISFYKQNGNEKSPTTITYKYLWQ
jgi:hypothetical protein